MHGPLIEKSSYIDGDFIVPTTVEELAPLLPGNTQYDDIDDLLITIGKQPDRALLHTFVSKMFKVPQKLLVNAEKNRASLVPNSVLDAVYDRRRIAKDAAEAAASAQSATFSYSAEQEGQVATPAADKAWPTPMAATSASVSSQSIERTTPSLVNGTVEYADPEHLCQYCLPVYGDEIVGTRSERDSKETTPRVHRLGCPIAQRALNRALSENQRPTGGGVDPLNSSSSTPRVDNVSLRWKVNSRYQGPTTSEVPVKLQWAEFAGDDVLTHTFPCEIIVHAQDRKLLLADCSELVSELSEIMKTGSQTTNEHATLVFLIRIHCLDDLQKVMNSLQQVRSVMAVERRVRSAKCGVNGVVVVFVHPISLICVAHSVPCTLTLSSTTLLVVVIFIVVWFRVTRGFNTAVTKQKQNDRYDFVTTSSPQHSILFTHYISRYRRFHRDLPAQLVDSYVISAPSLDCSAPPTTSIPT